MPRKTYQIGQRRRRNWRLLIAGGVVLLLAGAGGYIYHMYQQDTKVVIKNTAGSTHPFAIPNSKTQHFDEGVFAFDAPTDWKLIKHDTGAYNLYSFRATLTNADNRYLDIYVDSLPLSLAVNKAVRVQAQGNNLTHGEVSENCTSFTTGQARTPGGAQPLTVPAKWDGVDFICDNDNINRNVIGTSAPGSVNKVVLSGQTTGSHALFFVYTDNNATPDYSLFYNMLESFVVE